MVFFTKRNKYSWNVYLDKDSFLTLINYLKQAGFTNFLIKLPLKEKTSERSGNNPILLEKFLETDRNYKALILIAKNKTEEVRIIFKNSGDAQFYDDIFPTANSDLTSNYYISSNNLTRTYTLDLFLKDFFKEHSVSAVLSTISMITLLSIFIFSLFTVALGKTSISNYLIVLAIILWIILIITSARLSPLTGLYFHSPTDAKPFSTAITKLKEQWLILVIGGVITFLLGLLGTYVGRLLKW